MRDFRSQLPVAVVLLLGCGAFCVLPAGGQAPSTGTTPAAAWRPATAPASSFTAWPRSQADPETVQLSAKYRKLEQQVRDLSRQHQQAKSDSERSKLRQELVDVTENQFELRNQMRKRELARLEKALQRVETKINQQESLKDQIIDKRIADLLNEDDALQWESITDKASPFGTAAVPGYSQTPATDFLPQPAYPRAAYPGPGVYGSAATLPAPRTLADSQVGFVRWYDTTTRVATPQGVTEEKRAVVETVPNPADQFRLTPGLTMSGPKITDSDLKPTPLMKNLKRLELTGTSVTDEGLNQLERLDILEALILGGTSITDAGLQSVAKLKRLRHIDIGDNPNITDEGLRSLSRVETLISLDLRKTKITGAGVKDLLAELPIQHLWLDATSVGDELVEVFKETKSLKCLSLINTKITDKGRQALWSDMPDCAFRFLPPRIPSTAAAPSGFPRRNSPIGMPGPAYLPSLFPKPAASPYSAQPSTSNVAAPNPISSRPSTSGDDPFLADGISVREAEGRVEIAEKQLARVTTLYDRGVISTSEVEEAKNELKLAQLVLDRVESRFKVRQQLLELEVQGAKVALEEAVMEYKYLQDAKDKRTGAVSESVLRRAKSKIRQLEIANQKAQTMLDAHASSGRKPKDGS